MVMPDKLPINVTVRAHLLIVFIAIAFCLVGVRLWYLQIVNGEVFRDKSENNRLQTVFLPPPRGIIRDRNGEILVTNRPSFNLEFIAEDTKDVRKTIERLAKVIDADPEELQQRLSKQRRRRKFEPKLLQKDISRDLVAKVSAVLDRLPGVVINVAPSRLYLHNELAAHVLGYTREITQSQIESPKYPKYFPGDIIGQFGIEAQWERYLQGSRGRKRVIVNARGTRVGELSYAPEVRGSTLISSIDKGLQGIADKALGSQRGAIVALDARTGGVLALSSADRFDPNIFTGELSPKDWKDIISGRKLNDRAVQGVYPPGSVFKIFTGIAALTEGVMSPKDTINCPGYYFFAGRRYGCWKKTGHGRIGYKASLVQSCDVYYYMAGQRLGIDRIFKYADMYGLGRKTGIALPDESAGLVPSTKWKRRAHRKAEDKKWYPGETLSVSIGQGAVSVTPIQVARALAAVVNGGKLLVPKLVRQILAPDGRVIIDETAPNIEHEIQLDPVIMALVKEALVGVVNDPSGTARRAKVEPELGILVGGKTGTAQVAALQHGTEGRLNDHAWFASFAPANDPEIVVVALVENGGHGGAVAAPVAQQVLNAYFRAKKGLPLEAEPEPTKESIAAPKRGVRHVE